MACILEFSRIPRSLSINSVTQGLIVKRFGLGAISFADL